MLARRRLAAGGGFVAGQLGLQIVTLCTGFFVLRWMDVTDFAQYSIAFGFGSLSGVFLDLGLSSAVIPLVGERTDDGKLVGAYIRSARHLRSRMFLVIAPASVALFLAITINQDWGIRVKLELIAAMLVLIGFQGWQSLYSTPLLMDQQMGRFYGPQVVVQGAKLTVYFLLHKVARLSSAGALWFAALGVVVTAWLFRRFTAERIEVPPLADPDRNREVVRYVLPLMPAFVFTAFQGQIATFIISITGSTQSLAETAALSRLSQIFLVLAAFNFVVLAPRFARLPRRLLRRRYIQAMTGAVILAAGVSALGFWLPQIFLSLLGPSYDHLTGETGWFILGSALGYVSSLIWAIHTARRWVLWWHSALYITVVLCAQATCGLLLHLDTTLAVSYFQAVTGAAILAGHAVGGALSARTVVTREIAPSEADV
jgi:O-antigen/teichoic acid export membrane protein